MMIRYNRRSGLEAGWYLQSKNSLAFPRWMMMIRYNRRSGLSSSCCFRLKNFLELPRWMMMYPRPQHGPHRRVDLLFGRTIRYTHRSERMNCCLKMKRYL